jgi:TatA/E family protein of Tat protein translocase
MLSIPHLIIIFLVALIVFGPEKLPELARTLSKAMFEFNRATGGLRETLQNEMQQLEREIMDQRNGATPSRGPAPAVAPEAAWPPEPVLEHPTTPETSGEAAAEPADESGPAIEKTGEATGEPATENTAETTVEMNSENSETTPDPKPGQPSNGHPTAA